ncbi:hypothetical protein PANT_9c00245 [Moesziomyces antarcticus T-34]|uniref:Uncharacterized protein n=1 Tax=Pseudozyma antarctica (strain T-34) TaxID=1151754 RepID=M9M131_PSEA3|nr:hypothetical protein PANT_9c00245 [Moesziomyces antarcticus T-34]
MDMSQIPLCDFASLTCSTWQIEAPSSHNHVSFLMAPSIVSLQDPLNHVRPLGASLLLGKADEFPSRCPALHIRLSNDRWVDMKLVSELDISITRAPEAERAKDPERCLSAIHKSTDTSLGSPLSSPPIPPKRPPRLRRPPRDTLATQQDAPMNLDRYGTFFTRFEPPASPIESTPGCSRGDSICLDPDLASEIAKKVVQAEQQNLEQASTVPVGTRRLDSPAASASLLFSDVTESKADGRYWINAASEHTHASTSSLGTLRHSASRVSLASAFSNSSDEGSNTNGTYEAAMHRRRHAPRAQKGKTLISRAFKKFGTNRVVSDLGPSRSQDDLVDWSRSTRDMCSSPALSILSATSSPDIRSRRISSESDLSSAGPCSRASTPTQYSSPVFGRHRLAQQVAFEETEELMDDGVTASPRMAPDGYFDTMVDSHVHLPSYHRGLRKQIYPPRVRYELRDTPSPVASPQMQQQQLPSPHASPSQWTTKLAGIHSHSFEPVRAGSPRLDFAGPRRFGTS